MSNKKLALPKPILSHYSIYYKNEFPEMYVPVPLRTAITVRLFWWNKASIKIRTGWFFIKKKFTKPVPESKKPESVKEKSNGK